jgi:hypothetical protein
VIQFSGGVGTNYLTPGTPLVLAGGGQYQFVGGSSYLELTNDIIAGLVMQGGTLELGADFQGGAITNLALAGMTLTNTLPVEGTFNMTNGVLYGNFTVAGGAVLNENNVSLSGAVTVANGGVFTAGGVQINPAGSVTVSSGGEFDVGPGTLAFFGPLTNSGTMNMTNYGINLYNDGTTNYQGGLVNAGGEINLYGSAGISGIYTHNYFINEGGLTKSLNTGAATINVADFTNSGAITAETGTLHLNLVTLQSAGSLNVGLNSAGNYGQIAISGNAALTGVFGVHLNNGFIPVAGASYTVFTYGSLAGNFSGFNLPANVVDLRPVYGSTALTLVFQPIISLSGTNLVFNANGTPGNQSVLLSSTNLTAPLADWVPVVTNTFDVNGHYSFTNNVGAGKPSEFFIFESP